VAGLPTNEFHETHPPGESLRPLRIAYSDEHARNFRVLHDHGRLVSDLDVRRLVRFPTLSSGNRQERTHFGGELGPLKV